MPLVTRSAVVDDSRRAGLEQYLRCAIQAAVDADNSRALQTLAVFLDDDFRHLLINQSEY